MYTCANWLRRVDRSPITTIFAGTLCILISSPIYHARLNRVCYVRPDFILPLDHAIRHDLCTHLVIAFAAINATSQIAPDERFTQFCRHARRIVDRFAANRSETKLMFSVAGGEDGGFQRATSSGENRRQLVDSILAVILECDLDGVDLDWEFPAWSHNFSRRFERENLTHLLKDIRTEFGRLETRRNRKLVLSAAVAAQITMIHVCYQPKQIARYVDFINLMAYDFYIHKWYWPFVGHNSALHARSHDFGLAITFNTEWAANYWHTIGVAREKIMIGIPTYGKRFTLYSRYLNYPGAIAISNNADCSYSDVCDFLSLNGTTQKFDNQAMVPYAFNGYDWISFENELSARLKTQWIVRNGFGGAMLFSLNADDFRQRCQIGDGDETTMQIFPIHRAVQLAMSHA